MNAYGVGLGARHTNVEAEMRLARPAPARTVTSSVSLDFDRFELDEANARLTCDGVAVDLSPRPFAVLCALARRPGSLVTKNALLDEVWGHRFVSESVLKTVIGKLRTALGDDARNPRFIETVARRGYRFIGISNDDAAARGTPDTAQGSKLTPERALGEIRELLRRCTGRKPLLLLLDHPDGAEKAVAGLMDYIARWSPAMATDATLSAR
jgi:DNA-binding winged helix-turn-helix (wHTH) protein